MEEVQENREAPEVDQPDAPLDPQPAAEPAPEQAAAPEAATPEVVDAEAATPGEADPEPESDAETPRTDESVTDESVADDLIIAEAIEEPVQSDDASSKLKAIIEAAIYITDDPLTAEQIATATEQPLDRVKETLRLLVVDYAAPDRGLSIREVAGGYKMATKPEHHESIRLFVKGLQAPFKLSQASLETLAVVAYKQPITAPEIMEIRGVQGAGVLKTLIDRKLVAAAGRKDVLGKPILYKTTREFLIQFGLNSLAELPTLKEFEDLGRLAFNEEENALVQRTAPQQQTPPVAAEPPAPPEAAQAEPEPSSSPTEPAPTETAAESHVEQPVAAEPVKEESVKEEHPEEPAPVAPAEEQSTNA
jgi:segregation and condensation protein B